MQTKKTGKRSPFTLLLEVFKGSRLLYTLALLFMLLGVFGGFLLPQMIRFVVDSIVGGDPVPDIPLIPELVSWAGGVEALRQNLLLIGVLVIVVAAAGGVCNFLYKRFLAIGAEGIIQRLRDKLYEHIQHLPYEWHVKIQTGDIIQRCTSDVDVVRNFIFSQLLEMVRIVLLVVIAYSLLFPMNTVMSLASVVFLPVMLGYSFIYLQQVSDRFLAADEAEGALMGIAQENFTGVRVVRAFGRERYEVDRFDKQNHHFANLWMRLGELLSTFWGLSDLITGLQLLTICVLGIFQAAAGNITVGGFIVFLTYNSMTIWPVRGLGRILSEASKTGVSLGRLQDILDNPREQDSEDALTTTPDGDIEFKNVSFSYEEQPVLRDVSFTIAKGQTLGILGSTGSGKTTVAHLLCRLYDLEADSGEITIGGVNIDKYKRSWLRENIGIVLQEPFLFSRTIQDNVASLSTSYSADDVREATKISCVDDAIQQFTHGYDTVVGERGVTLSGGQKQRVAIARTILKNPPILIFDDSLSAVDTETDAKIRASLSKRTEGVTTIIIAHRITSILGADKIMVMDEGKVVEIGTHAELMELGGVYRQVFDMQESAGN